MKIALAMEYPLMQQGGTEVLVRELIRGLSRHFEVVLVSGDREIKDIPEEFSQHIAAQLYWDKPNGNALTAEGLAQALADKGIQLAHFHFGGTYEWRSNRFWQCPIHYMSRHRIRCLSTNHLANEWLNCGVNPKRPIWQKHLYQLFAVFSRSMIYRNLKVEICVSKQDQKRVARQFPWFRHKIGQRYHSLLSADAPEPDLEKRDPVIVCIGTIGGRKAQPNLAEAFGRIAGRYPQWTLRFIGRPESAQYVEQIKASANRHGVQTRVEVMGRLSDEETLNQMRSASIIGMPSLQEGLGLSLQEALFNGCVALGSRVGGIPELIDDGSNGLLVPPGDVDALSAGLERVMSDPCLLARLRKETRPSVLRKGMTRDAMIESYLRLYRQLADTDARIRP